MKDISIINSCSKVNIPRPKRKSHILKYSDSVYSQTSLRCSVVGEIFFIYFKSQSYVN